MSLTFILLVLLPIIASIGGMMIGFVGKILEKLLKWGKEIGERVASLSWKGQLILIGALGSGGFFLQTQTGTEILRSASEMALALREEEGRTLVLETEIGWAITVANAVAALIGGTLACFIHWGFASLKNVLESLLQRQ
jgi:hypothetical protein